MIWAGQYTAGLGPAVLGWARQVVAPLNVASHRRVWRGAAWHGKARCGRACLPIAGLVVAVQGVARQFGSRLGSPSKLGMAGLGLARFGESRRSGTGRGTAWHCKPSLFLAGPDPARHGEIGMAWRCWSGRWLGFPGRGEASLGQARPGSAVRGRASLGRSGRGFSRRGGARPGAPWRGVTWHGSPSFLGGSHG